MTTKEYKEMARRLSVRGIEAYKQRLIYEEDLINGEDKRRILEQIDLQDRLNRLHSLNDCDEEFEL